MGLGGGTFITQNKVLPGSYINVVSALAASMTISERGIVACPIELDWGVDGKAFFVDATEVVGKSIELFGYPYTHESLVYVRELFKNARQVLFYRINSGSKATATIGNITATAKHSGSNGDKVAISVAANVDNAAKYDVVTLYNGQKVETQTVADVSELQVNAFVVFSGTGELTENAGTYLSGGTNGSVTGSQYTAALAAFEPYSYHVLVCPTDEATVIDTFVAYTKRLREELGIKLQTVVYRKAADYEGVMNVWNSAVEGKVHGLVYWIAGLQGSAPINRSTTNHVYDGELVIDVDFTQSELSNMLESGCYLMHQVGDDIRVLSDINSLVHTTSDKGDDFKSNQVIRVTDEVANTVARTFNDKYLGVVQNNAIGRSAFWNDIVNMGQQLEKIGAIEAFDSDEVKVIAGETKGSITAEVPTKPVTAMNKLYMSVIVN